MHEGQRLNSPKNKDFELAHMVVSEYLWFGLKKTPSNFIFCIKINFHGATGFGFSLDTGEGSGTSQTAVYFVRVLLETWKWSESNRNMHVNYWLQKEYMALNEPEGSYWPKTTLPYMGVWFHSMRMSLNMGFGYLS